MTHDEQLARFLRALKAKGYVRILNDPEFELMAVYACPPQECIGSPHYYGHDFFAVLSYDTNTGWTLRIANSMTVVTPGPSPIEVLI